MKSESVKFHQLLLRGLQTSINAKLQVNIDRLLESTHFTFTRGKESRIFNGADFRFKLEFSNIGLYNILKALPQVSKLLLTTST